MKNHFYYFLLSVLVVISVAIACGSGEETGNCSISCGGFGTGQPFVQTNHPFMSEADCKELGMEKPGGCRTAFCPPTGNPDDCFQVWPE